jgi:hypothetical protein
LYSFISLHGKLCSLEKLILKASPSESRTTVAIRYRTNFVLESITGGIHEDLLVISVADPEPF